MQRGPGRLSPAGALLVGLLWLIPSQFPSQQSINPLDSPGKTPRPTHLVERRLEHKNFFIVFLLKTNNLRCGIPLARGSSNRPCLAARVGLPRRLPLSENMGIWHHRATEGTGTEKKKVPPASTGDVTHNKHQAPLSGPCCQRIAAPICIISQRTVAFAVLMPNNPPPRRIGPALHPILAADWHPLTHTAQ